MHTRRTRYDVSFQLLKGSRSEHPQLEDAARRDINFRACKDGSDGGSTVNQCSRTTLVRPVLGSSQRLARRGLAGAHRFQRIDPCAYPANTRGRRSTRRNGANRKAGQPAHGLARGFIYDEERGRSPLVRARCASPSFLPGARTSIPFLPFPVLLGLSRPWFLCTFPLFF